MAFPTLEQLDGFVRTESPLSNGSKWLLLTGKSTTGQCATSAYMGKTAFASGEDGAYWNPTQFTNPAVSLLLTEIPTTAERFYSLYACLQSPNLSTWSGYKLVIERLATSGKANLIVQKWVSGALSSTLLTLANVALVSKSSVGFTVKSGVLQVWTKTEAGEYVVAGEVSDSTWSKGFVGIGAKGNIGKANAFSAGTQVITHEHTLTASQGQGAKRMAIGNSSTSLTVSDQTTVGRQEGYKFTALATTTITELWFRTNGTANTGITSLVLGIAADNAGVPGTILGQGTFTGQPPTESWIVVSGLSIAVTEGTEYWLMELPLGESGKQLHYNASTVEGAGTANVESKSGASFTKLEVSAGGYETFNQGPIGFQAMTPSLLPRSIARTLAPSQAQVVSKTRVLPHTFTASATQGISMVYNRPHSQTATQAQAISMSHPIENVVFVSQGQAIRSSPVGTALDTFNRANEKPMATGGTWGTLGSCAGPGEVSSERWKASDTFAGGEDGVYFLGGEFTNPCIIAELITIKVSNERYFSLYACLSNPSTTKITGYRVRVVQTAEPALKFNIIIEKLVENVPTVIAEKEVSWISEPRQIAFTVQGGVLTVWTRLGSVNPWEALLEASDGSFSKGFVGYGERGNVGTIDAVYASAGATALLTKAVGKNLSVGQTQSAIVQFPSKNRSLTVAQSQLVKFTRELARKLSASNGQTASWAMPNGRALSCSQGSAAKAIVTVGRNLAATQAQAPARGQVTLRALSSTQGQSARRVATTSRSFAITQPQSPQRVATTSKALLITQGQSPQRGETASKALSITQAQSVHRLVAVARTLAITQGQSLQRATVISKAFTITQPQEAHEHGALAHALSSTQAQSVTRTIGVTRMMSCAQSQAPSRSVTTGKRLAVSQEQMAQRRAGIAHTFVSSQATTASWANAGGAAFSCSQTQVVSRSVALTRTLRAAQAQSPARRTAVSRALASSQTQVVLVSRASSASLSTTQPQAIVLMRVPSPTLRAFQAAGVTRGARVGRTLTDAQEQGVAAARAPAHRFAVAQEQSAITGPSVLSRELILEQGQDAQAEGLKGGHILATTATTIATIERQIESRPVVKMTSTSSPASSIVAGVKGQRADGAVGGPEITSTTGPARIKSTVGSAQIKSTAG